MAILRGAPYDRGELLSCSPRFSFDGNDIAPPISRDPVQPKHPESKCAQDPSSNPIS
jgi:hypothetical protein